MSWLSRRHKIAGGDKTRNNKKCGDEEMIITGGNHKDGMLKHRISKNKTDAAAMLSVNPAGQVHYKAFADTSRQEAR